MVKCKICGTEFKADKEWHYVARDNEMSGGLITITNPKEEERFMIALTVQIVVVK